jgi:hypothetical protein
MKTPDDGRLDDLERKIDDARKQAEDHGIITDPDKPQPEYVSGDPVGLPETDDETASD